MIISITKVTSFQLFSGDIVGPRHQTHVNEVGTARATEMGMSEAVNHMLVVVIARARVPSDHLFRIGTQLHHALRHRGTGEGATTKGTCLVGLRADKRIDELGVVLHLCAQP